jgi:hypothetical protein
MLVTTLLPYRAYPTTGGIRTGHLGGVRCEKRYFLGRGTFKSCSVKDIAKYRINSYIKLSVEGGFRIFFPLTFITCSKSACSDLSGALQRTMDSRTYKVILLKPNYIPSVPSPNKILKLPV